MNALRNVTYRSWERAKSAWATTPARVKEFGSVIPLTYAIYWVVWNAEWMFPYYGVFTPPDGVQKLPPIPTDDIHTYRMVEVRDPATGKLLAYRKLPAENRASMS